MLRYKFIVIVLLLGAVGFTQTFSQKSKNRNGKARMETAKKMKLLEILDLSDKEADDFLVKFTNVEKVIKEKGSALRKANKELIKYLDENPKGKELGEKSNAVVSAQKDLHSAIDNRINVMKQTLSEQNFAKYLAFESVYNKKIRNFKSKGHKGKMKKGKGKRGEHKKYKGKRNNNK